MDEQDRMKTSSILETNQTNAPTPWVNPGTQHNYTVAEGHCREFTLDAQIGVAPSRFTAWLADMRMVAGK